MSIQEIQNNKEAYIALCRQYIKRDGLEKLLDYLEKTDFYVAPSSTNYHLNIAGGLCQHSMNVFHTCIAIYNNCVKPHLGKPTCPFKEEVSEESIAIVSLFHDLCKINLYQVTEKFKKDESGRWVTYTGYRVDDEFPFGHGEKSCLRLYHYMELKQEELLAIRWHMGMFDIAEQGSAQRYAFKAALEKSPLVCMLHNADMLASNCMEVTTEM